MATIRRALLSVSRKEGLVELARFLVERDVELISTGGTARALAEAGLPVTRVQDVTGFPEILGGRVKTLHPMISGGILGRADQVAEMEQHGIKPIDLVVVNLYPFEETTARPGCTRDEAVENIDIGGPTMVRAAAKNHARVTIVVDPADYGALMEEMASGGGTISETTRALLAARAFRHTAAYDAAIATFLTPAGEPFPERKTLAMERLAVLRYGENPHQQAALYAEAGYRGPSVATATQLGGKALSYNNLADADGALSLLLEFEQPAAVIVKHTNPCGGARHASSLTGAFRAALACDPMSAFGGIVALNRPVDRETAEAVAETFFEVVLAPSFDEDALARLQRKKNLRLLAVAEMGSASLGELDCKRIRGGYLLTEWDDALRAESRVVSAREPSPDELAAMDFAWRVVKHVRSNAIVLTNRDQTVGIGAGQMSRVDSVELAVRKAQLPTTGTVVASDAFFPFRDGVEAAAGAGVTAVIQPGGSVRDEEVIEAANELSLAMIFTGMRHFRHG